MQLPGGNLFSAGELGDGRSSALTGQGSIDAVEVVLAGHRHRRARRLSAVSSVSLDESANSGSVGRDLLQPFEKTLYLVRPCIVDNRDQRG